MKTVFVDIRVPQTISVVEDTQYVIALDPEVFEINSSLELIFEKSGVSAEILGVYRLKEGQKLNLTTSSVHKVPHTSCITKIKSVLDDRSFSDYTGKIIIEKSAQQTNSYLQDDVLTVGNEAVSNSSPILQIDANDVKASHGATMGRVDEDKVYYLKSRGLTRKEAEDLIIEGFFESVISQISNEKIRAEVKKNL